METINMMQPELPDRPIYHYTSQKGLLGIVTSKKIWATNIQYLNDETELTYAIELTREEVQKLINKLQGKDIELLEEIARRLDTATWAGYDSSTSIYVCSFSTECDQLSQWRGYCPDGNGFSIGFDFSRQPLIDLIKEQGFTLCKCKYKVEEQLDLVKQLMTKALDTFHQTHLGLLQDQIVQALATINFNIEFLRLAPQIKHPKYSEENEWRLISGPILVDNPRVKFREGKSMIIPYFEFNLVKENDPLHLQEIWIGPTKYWQLSRASLQTLLVASQVKGPDIIAGKFRPEVKITEIPYRAP